MRKLKVKPKVCIVLRGKGRPCEVMGSRGVFHGFFKEDKVILSINSLMTQEDAKKVKQHFERDGMASPGCEIKKQPPRSLRRVNPEEVRFLDGERRCGNDKGEAEGLPPFEG